jgi:hypothetical protein
VENLNISEVIDKDMGVSNPDIREALEKYLADYAKTMNGEATSVADEVTEEELAHQGWAFVDGYEACLKQR